MKVKKVFVSLLLTFVLLSSVVFATDVMPISVEPEKIVDITVQEPSTTASNSQAKEINEDKYIYNTDSYSISDIVYGNIFASTTKFVVNPRNKGGIIYGNIFLISSEATIESDVTYSNTKDKTDTYTINSINSKSIIYGNVYALADTFTLQAGSEIYGDLYVAANTVNIEPNAVIHGNIFVTSNNINLNGQIKLSAYVTTKTFNMNYYSYIDKDLCLNSENATLSGVINRNAFLTIDNSLVTKTDFKVNQNLSVINAKDFTFSGKINGNAKINAKNLTFKNDDSEACIIRGDLDYSVGNNEEVPTGIVNGKVNASKYVKVSDDRVSLSLLSLKFIVLLVYVFGVVFLCKFFAQKAIEKLPVLNFSNILVSLGIGFASMFLIFIIFILLCICGIGVSLAFFAVAGYLFLLGLALPLFLNKIAEAIKLNLNSYVKLLIVTAVFYLINLIPVIGSTIAFIVILIGIGQIIFSLFKRKNN